MSNRNPGPVGNRNHPSNPNWTPTTKVRGETTGIAPVLLTVLGVLLYFLLMAWAIGWAN